LAWRRVLISRRMPLHTADLQIVTIVALVVVPNGTAKHLASLTLLLDHTVQTIALV
jgi:hypothetical protein